MSKVIKQMEMDALKQPSRTFAIWCVLSSEKLTCQIDYGMRTTLRKKKIRVQMVKNTLAQRFSAKWG